MYTLTLTKSERMAIDWVGHRYRHGNDLREILSCAEWTGPDDCEWDGDYPIQFDILEHEAWMICDIIEEGLDCFSLELCAKLHDFAEGVV